MWKQHKSIRMTSEAWGEKNFRFDLGPAILSPAIANNMSFQSTGLTKTSSATIMNKIVLIKHILVKNVFQFSDKTTIWLSRDCRILY